MNTLTLKDSEYVQLQLATNCNMDIIDVDKIRKRQMFMQNTTEKYKTLLYKNQNGLTLIYTDCNKEDLTPLDLQHVISFNDELCDVRGEYGITKSGHIFNYKYKILINCNNDMSKINQRMNEIKKICC